jgi:hypothetical protein
MMIAYDPCDDDCFSAGKDGLGERSGNHRAINIHHLNDQKLSVKEKMNITATSKKIEIK